jgi:hypothetical protein
MSEFQIIFSTPLIPKIQDDTKIQTRRLTGLDGINEHPDDYRLAFMDDEYEDDLLRASFEYKNSDLCIHVKSPYGKKGDLLWCRESHGLEAGKLIYKADEGIETPFFNHDQKWKPSIHMKREYCRLFLLNEGVGIERIQDISEDDCIKEGVRFDKDSGYYFVGDTIMDQSAKACFIKLWNSIHGQWKWSKKKMMFVCYPWSTEDIPLFKGFPYNDNIVGVKASPNPFVFVVNFSRINDYKK